MTLLQVATGYSVVLSLVYLAVLATLAVVLALRLGGRREESMDDHDALSASRFTIPVSLIVPVTSHVNVHATLAALLGLNYPEFEVIVVAEGLATDAWASLKRDWGLEAKEFYYRQTLATADVQKIFRSTLDPRLMIVEKTPTASRADAMNIGVNLARFRYVSSVEPGLVFDADALLRAMSAPLRDPASVLAATSHVEAHNDAGAGVAQVFRPGLGLQGALQRLASIRALMDSRLVWRTLHTALGPHDGVSVWRRDALVQLGGFSTRAADPDLDMMVRLQTAGHAKAGLKTRATGEAVVVAQVFRPASSDPAPAMLKGRVVRSPEIFGQMAPRSLTSLVRQRTRRQLAALQTLWTCRKLAAPTFAYLVISELVTPFVQAWVVVATIAGAVSGWLSWTDAALAIVLLSFGNAIVSGVALLLRGSSPGAPDESTLTRLLLVAPLDFIVSGGVSAYARTAGFFAFLKGAFVSETI